MLKVSDMWMRYLDKQYVLWSVKGVKMVGGVLVLPVKVEQNVYLSMTNVSTNE